MPAKAESTPAEIAELRGCPVNIQRILAVMLVAGGLTACSTSAGESRESGVVSGSPVATPSASADGSPSSVDSSAAPDAVTVRAIQDHIAARQQAMIDGDIATLRSLSTEDSQARHIGGNVQSQEDWYAQISSGYFDYHSIELESLSVTMTGPDTAMALSRSVIDVTIGGSRRTWQVQTTTSYVREDGRWLSGDSSSTTY